MSPDAHRLIRSVAGPVPLSVWTREAALYLARVAAGMPTTDSPLWIRLLDGDESGD